MSQSRERIASEKDQKSGFKSSKIYITQWNKNMLTKPRNRIIERMLKKQENIIQIRKSNKINNFRIIQHTKKKYIDTIQCKY